MEVLAVFLRGVNVKGTRMMMVDLQKVFSSMGYRDVKTLLASGNVVVSTEEALSLGDHKVKIEDALGAYFDYEANVFVMAYETVASICQEAAKHLVPEDHQHYLIVSDDPSLPDELEKVFEDSNRTERESLIRSQLGLYWIVPKGNTLKAGFGDKLLGKKYKKRLTTRTVKTVAKVYKAMTDRMG